MKMSKYIKFLGIAAAFGFVVLFAGSSEALAQRRSVTVKFEAGIYRDWDRAWMNTAPSDVIATIKTSNGSFSKSPSNYRGLITFNGVPCGGNIKINIRFVGMAGYKANSRNYTRPIPCGKATVNLGRLEYGRW